MSEVGAEPLGDPFDVRLARACPELLRPFNVAGVLAPADVHVAVRLASMCKERDETVMLAGALAVRAPRLGHVLVDLATVRHTAAVDAEDQEPRLSKLPWPEPESWRRALAASALCAVGEEDAAPAPLRLVGLQLYLDRYWSDERRLAEDLRRMSDAPAEDVDLQLLARGLARLFGAGRGDRQALAAAAAVLRRLSVMAGGPGTGKTTTVARVVALLAEQALASGAPPPRVALAAPTGKAAARLQEAVHGEATALAVSEQVRRLLLGLRASTLHRLLGSRPDSHSRFAHDRSRRLPHDVVIVDETSMISLSLMARLVEALRPQARLVLVGDPGQLASIEAGAVLGDIVGPAAEGLLLGSGSRARLQQAVGWEVEAREPPQEVRVGDGIVALDRVHRFGGAIARLAAAVRRGDEDAVARLLREPSDQLIWIPVDPAQVSIGAGDWLATVRSVALDAARAIVAAAQLGDSATALGSLGAFRMLCAHRRGPHGVSDWTARVQGWLADELDGYEPGAAWYAGRPLLVTRNDYELGLHNGDTGVVVRCADGRLRAAFQRRGAVVEHSPMRLGAVDTVYAMTIHKSQGSQFDTAAVLLPDPGSRILSRELLYTAITRARTRLMILGGQEAITAALRRPAARASGLRARLWGPES